MALAGVFALPAGGIGPGRERAFIMPGSHKAAAGLWLQYRRFGDPDPRSDGVKDRLGNWTRYGYDRVRRQVRVTDARTNDLSTWRDLLPLPGGVTDLAVEAPGMDSAAHRFYRWRAP